jgi:hypothetical protein
MHVPTCIFWASLTLFSLQNTQVVAAMAVAWPLVVPFVLILVALLLALLAATVVCTLSTVPIESRDLVQHPSVLNACALQVVAIPSLVVSLPVFCLCCRSGWKYSNSDKKRKVILLMIAWPCDAAPPRATSPLLRHNHSMHY